MKTTLDQLMSWYEGQCDGMWEHQHGVQIDTLDNPGWAVKISLVGTSLEHVPFAGARDVSHDVDWINRRVTSGRFEGFGGRRKLDAIIGMFLKWANAQPPTTRDQA
jgi:hypothetical protein